MNRGRNGRSAGAQRHVRPLWIYDMVKEPYVYIVTNKRNGTLYIGVTSNLVQRVVQHREGMFDGFSKQHATTRLVWLEGHPTMASAIEREKVLKKYRRIWKIRLIEERNPDWLDLFETLA